MRVVRRVLAMAAATTLVVMGVHVAHGSGSSKIVCLFQGSGSVSPPVTYKNGSVVKTYSFSGKATCEDGGKSGAASASGSGAFSCLSGTSSATISMPSGDSLSMQMSHHLNTFNGSGSSTSGPNAGQGAKGAFEFHGLGAAGCAGSGVTSASVNGVIQY